MCLCGVGIAIYFHEVFQCYAFPQCHNIWMNKFFQDHCYIVGTLPLPKGGFEIQAKISKKGGGNFWIKGGTFTGGGGFLDIIFHPFQILF